MKKQEKKAVAFDQDMYDRAASDLRDRLELAKELCKIWNGNAIMPRMNQEYFAQLISGGVEYFENKYLTIFAENMNTMVPGQGDAYRENNLRARPGGGYERGRFDRYVSSLRGGTRIASSNLVHFGLIEFDESGAPHISDQTYQAIRDLCTAFETPENKALREAGEALAEAANKAHQAMTSHAYNLIPESLREQIVMPLNSYPAVIQMSAHAPGEKSLAPVILDRVNGKYVFNNWCLTYGVQGVTPPPKPIKPETTEKKVEPVRAQPSKYQPQAVKQPHNEYQPQIVKSMS